MSAMSKVQNIWQKIGMGAGSIAGVLALAQQAGVINMLPAQDAAAVGAIGLIVGGVSALYHAVPGSSSAAPSAPGVVAAAGK